MEPTGKTSEEVEVPKLAENGRNWKIYRVKIIEATAMDITDPLGVLAGWQPDDGSYNWECLDAILKWTFYTSVPITILRPIWKLDTTHEIFNYLAKHFCDNNPIVDPHTKKSKPSTNKVDGAGTAAEDISADSEKQKESPTSESAAAETLVSANRDEEDLPCTQDLTRGTQDVNVGNVGRTQDPCTSLEASAKVTSAKCTETTAVVLESALHKMQNQLQDSLPLTSRLPIEGEPNACKQEAAESVMTAGCTNRMAEMAEPTEMIADIDRTAPLDGEPAETACGVDEGDETGRKDLRLPKAGLYCEERHQHNENMTDNIPSTYGLPLEGEWTVYLSSESSKSKGCSGGMPGTADGDPSQGVEPADVRNETDMLIVLSIESESLGSIGIPCIHLGGMQMRMGDTNGSRCRADGSSCKTDVLSNQVDASRGQTDTLEVLNNAEIDHMSHGKGLSMYLSIGDAKHVVLKTDGDGSHANTSSGRGNVLSIETHVIKPENETANIRLPRKKVKPPDIPIGPARAAPNEPDGHGNLADTLSVYTDAHSIGNESETSANETDIVRTRQVGQRTRNLPYTPENGMPKRAIHWRRVNVDEIDVYLPWNTPVEVLGRTFVFGRFKSRDKPIAANIKSKRAEDGDGNVDGTMSGGGVHSI